MVHDGRAGEGTYRVHIHRKAEEVWYEVQVRVTNRLVSCTVRWSQPAARNKC